MFKNLFFYRFSFPSFDQIDLLNTSMESNRFVVCSGSMEKSAGWISPRNEPESSLFEFVAGHLIMKFMIEVKVVPSMVVKRKLDEQVRHIELTTGRKPGKKEIRDLRDDLRLGLIPLAFTKLSSVWVWFDIRNQLLIIDASNQMQVDEVITCLSKSFNSLVTKQINTKISPSAAMSAWLSSHEAPMNLSIDRECELKSSDESKAVVRYTRHPLDIEEVIKHISSGKIPTRVAMLWNSRVSFVLTESLQLKKIKFEDVVFEDASSGSDDVKDASFDADVAIATGELTQMLPELIEALGGEIAND